MKFPHLVFALALIITFTPLFANEKRSYIPSDSSFTENAEWMRNRGIHEWINGGLTVLPDYFVSTASVYSLLGPEFPSI